MISKQLPKTHNKNSQLRKNRDPQYRSRIRLLLNRQLLRRPLRSKKRELANNLRKCKAWEPEDKKSTWRRTWTQRGTVTQTKTSRFKTAAAETMGATFSEHIHLLETNVC